MDVIYTSELQDRLEEIEYDLESLDLSDAERNDLTVELKALQEVKAEVDGYADDTFEDGVQLIAEQDFPEYIQELLEDIGDVPKLPSYVQVDWEATAENLRVDYTEVEFDGTTYLFR